MVGLVKLLGIVIVVFGVIYLIKPVIMQRVTRYWMQGNRLYIAGGINLLFSVIFFSAAPKCSWPLFIGIIGAIALIKGIIDFVLGPKKLIPIMEELMKGSRRVLRLMAVIVLGLGVLIIYAV
ncbi:MAG: hypothetical protein JSV34_01755 [Candidatus Omnitrophota bacterium]|nr:MAG: hypothetical protein JSV34_01755 [Candidatus Omnitrophota bacterium]